MEKEKGVLYLVATPIGNLSDITERAKEVLRSVDVIACEDTRRTGLLLERLGIGKKWLESFHLANESAKSGSLIQMLLDGKTVALVSEAGTPLISDPGFPLVRGAIEAGIRVESIPGACALINALVLSGFPCEPFAFYGFLPQKEKKRRELLGELCSGRGEVRLAPTLVFYESPYRILRTLKDMSDIFEDRRIAVCREMTKKFEEVVRGTPAEALRHFEKKKPVGEFVIVVDGRDEGESSE